MKIVAYYRVSTQRQGASGLGLEAQRAAVAAYAAQHKATILAEYTEVESGRKKDRPELDTAIHHASITGARLVIAKLDRLSRNAAFLLNLQESKVDFVAADMPDANKLTVGIMALVAQQEAEAISERTKAALAAAKARGTRLGNPQGAKAFGGVNGAEKSAETRKAMADEHAAALDVTIAGLRAMGHISLRQIADQLNARGIKTPRGGKWYATSVKNLLARIDATAP
ncbi:recombinase family protein [Arenibacterium sp. CAU 1754]